MYRYNMSDIIIMLNSYYALWDTGIMKTKEMATVHKAVHLYLENYLHKSKKTISGRQFT